jgi:hypothetical protein
VHHFSVVDPMLWWAVPAVVVQAILLSPAVMMYFRSARVHMLLAEPGTVRDTADLTDSSVCSDYLLVAQEVAGNVGLSILGMEVGWDLATPLLLRCDQTEGVQDDFEIKLRVA